jgi:glycosyltransferase involved in cell wall biosynthesis
MRRITALLQTQNDGLRLGRCLETLYPCDEILVIDHGSKDDTVRVAREYGAEVLSGRPGISPEHYVAPKSATRNSEWLLFLDARESLTEALAATLYEWKSAGETLLNGATPSPAFSVFMREETPEGWIAVPVAKTRLVPHTWHRWHGNLPADEPSALALEGELLRFAFP